MKIEFTASSINDVRIFITSDIGDIIFGTSFFFSFKKEAYMKFIDEYYVILNYADGVVIEKRYDRIILSINKEQCYITYVCGDVGKFCYLLKKFIMLYYE